jgi:hypothetical protein
VLVTDTVPEPGKKYDEPILPNPEQTIEAIPNESRYCIFMKFQEESVLM